MAFTLAELVVKIRADDSKVRRALPQIRRGVERVQTSLRKMGQMARTAFSKMAAGLKRAAQAMAGMARYARLALLAVGGVIALTIKQASTAEEMHAKFMTVFREEGDAVSKWAAQYGKAVGRSKVDMETWLATIQDTFVPLGISRREATKLSKTIVKLGIDIASFNEKMDVDVINNLQSALVGQTRAVLNYGIVVNEAAVKQELLRMGVRKAWTDVSLATKVQARMNVILRSSTDAQGDAIRTIGSFANQMKRLKATWTDAAAVMGQAFIPAAIRLMASVRDMIEPIGNWVRYNQKLTAQIGLVTLGVLALLSVLPLLITSLTVLAAHPVLAALILLAATLAKIRLEIAGINAEIRTTAAGRIGPELTGKELAVRLKGLLAIRDKLKTQISTMRQIAEEEWFDVSVIGAVVPAAIKHLAVLKATEAEYEGIKEQITQVEAALKALQATEERGGEGDGEPDKPAASKAETAWITAFTKIERSRLSAHDLAIELLEDEVRAMVKLAREAGVIEAQKFAIITFYDEQADRIKKKFAEQESARRKKAFWDIIRENEAREAKVQARARELAGPARGASAISGIVEFARRIQEAVFRKREDAAQKRREDEKIKIARDQLTQQEMMVTLMTKFIPGLIPVP